MFNFFGPFARDPVEQLLQLYRITHRGGGREITTVTGISPLLLANALHKPIHKLTQYGLCTQDGTPTPDAPVDIVCNNGVVRYGAMGNNLYDPSTAVFEIGYYYNPNADGAETAAANNFIYHSYIPIEAGAAYVFYGRKQSDNRLSQYNRIHWYAADKTYIGTNTYTAGTIGKGVAPDNAVYARLSCNPQGASTAITEETVLGYNWTFCKGTAEQAFEPFEGNIYADGTDEVLTVSGANLFDASSYAEINAYVNANTGVLTAGSPGSMTQYCALIPCKPNAQYNITGRGTSAWGAFPSASIGTTATAFNKGGNLTTGANDKYLIGLVRANGDAIDYRNTLVVQETQTVNDVRMLLGLDNTYRDAEELINGIKTSKVGVKVLDGTENWSNLSNYYNISKTDLNTSSTVLPLNSTSIICTHLVAKSGMFTDGIGVGASYVNFKYDTIAATLDAWKAWLSEQYAAGTPVIVIYPLATETTEQTTPHALHTSEGTVIVDVTAAVGSVELEVEFIQAAGG